MKNYFKKIKYLLSVHLTGLLFFFLFRVIFLIANHPVQNQFINRCQFISVFKNSNAFTYDFSFITFNHAIRCSSNLGFTSTILEFMYASTTAFSSAYFAFSHIHTSVSFSAGKLYLYGYSASYLNHSDINFKACTFKTRFPKRTSNSIFFDNYTEYYNNKRIKARLNG